MSDDDKAACLADALAHAETLDQPVMIVVCQGPPRCDYTGDGPLRSDCPYCLRMRSDDPRTPEEVVAEMVRTQS